MKAARKKYRRLRAGTERTIDDAPLRTVQITLTGHSPYGDAVGTDADGRTIRVAYGIPGEEVIAEILEEQDEYAVGRVVDVVVASPSRVEPRCSHFGVCGGCQLQHIDYPLQLELKRRVVDERLRAIGGLIAPPVSATVANTPPWNYRNHARFTVRRNGALGFTHWHTHRFEPIDVCHIMDHRINEAKARLEGKAERARQVAIRFGERDNSYLIHPAMDPGAADGLETGQSGHEDRLFGVPFQVSAASFFQVNTHQAERMAALVRDRLRLKGTDFLLDAFAGVGTFAALLAPFCARVIAIEESAAAIRDSRVNLVWAANVEVIEGRTEDALAVMTERPTAVILDPPRSGCDPRVLEALGRIKPERLVYVSCEPETLARDLRQLVLLGFRVTDVTPLDMFPQTYHIECVATLERAAPASIVLASTSPRRVALLQASGQSFQALRPAAIEEPPTGGVAPAEYALAQARLKALSLATDSHVRVLGADTVVVAPDGAILGKPVDRGDARRMLETLRGKNHHVVTAVAVAEPGGRSVREGSLSTGVLMRDYSDSDIDAYLDSGLPLDRAGAYGIQDDQFRPVANLEGCRLNVVGLPLCLMSELLADASGGFTRTPTTTAQMVRPGCRLCASRNLEGLPLQ